MTTLHISAGYDDAFAPPPDERDWVPFRYIFGERGNLAFLLVLAILLLGFMCTLAAMAMKLGATDPLARYELMKTFGIAASILGVIAILISNAANAAGIRRTRHEIRNDLNAQSLVVQEMAQKANGGHLAAVKEVATQVREAERSQIIADPLCRKAIDEIASAAAEKAARKVLDELRGGQ
jgi:hypothetical protein